MKKSMYESETVRRYIQEKAKNEEMKKKKIKELLAADAKALHDQSPIKSVLMPGSAHSSKNILK